MTRALAIRRMSVGHAVLAALIGVVIWSSCSWLGSEWCGAC